MIRKAILLEITRTVRPKIVLYVLLFIFFIQYFLFFNGINFNQLETYQETLKTNDKEMSKNFTSYEQAGNFGFKLLLMPSSILLFFQNSNIAECLETIIDTSERNKVYLPFEPKVIFKTGLMADPSKIILYLGSLMFFTFGITFKIKLNDLEGNNKIGALVRLLLLDLIMIVNFLIFAILLKILGSAQNDFFIFFCYSLYTIIFLNMMYALGLLFSLDKKLSNYLWGFISWFIIVFLIPAAFNQYFSKSSSKFDTSESNINKRQTTLFKNQNEHRKKLQPFIDKKDKKNGFELQKKLAFSFLNTDYMDSQKKERNYNDQIKEQIDNMELSSALLPPVFFNDMAIECSSMGPQTIVDFLNYRTDLREEFMFFINEKRYSYKPGDPIKSFVKGDNNIFNAHSHLPSSYPLGLFLVFMYAALFFLWYYRKLNKTPKLETKAKAPAHEPTPGTFNFYFCKNQAILDQTYHYFKNMINTVAIAVIDFKELDLGLSLDKILHYYCQTSAVDLNRVALFLNNFGHNLDWLKTAEKSRENLKILYFIMLLSMTGEIYVLKEFLFGERFDFDQKARKCLSLLIQEKKTVIYLSTSMYDLQAPPLENYFAGETKTIVFNEKQLDHIIIR